ncbi:MAG: hypothetical protein GY811_19130 [Myxococcales bacterium]|nr:hypothetical protein [Myxococcales bacterium]
MTRRFRIKSTFALLALALSSPACGTSETAEQIKGFADKVCACKDAGCAESVQTEYLEWWKGNVRARGSEGDRKTVEKEMQRYAECHLALVGPEAEVAPKIPVPKVNLEPATPKTPAASLKAPEAAPAAIPKGAKPASPSNEASAPPE